MVARPRRARPAGVAARRAGRRRCALVIAADRRARRGRRPAGALAAEPFSEARLAALRAARTPVFVYFTADWCLTCKVNERGAMASAEVADAFRARGIKVLVGDWTRGDPAIGRFLERQGRSGVPLYLYYAPGAGEARRCCRQVLDAAKR